MTVVITAVLELRTHRGCGKSSQMGAYAQLYAYPLNERGDEDAVRDNNHALEIVRQLAGDDGEHFKEGLPPENAVRMFDIWMKITNTRHTAHLNTARITIGIPDARSALQAQ